MTWPYSSAYLTQTDWRKVLRDKPYSVSAHASLLFCSSKRSDWLLFTPGLLEHLQDRVYDGIRIILWKHMPG